MARASSPTVIIADDHQLVRAGLRSLIEEADDYQVIAEADDGEQAVSLAAHWQPDILALDITMPRLNGLQALSQIRQASANTKVLIVSMYAGADFVMRALRNQASGYLLKDAAATELSLAMDAVRKGLCYLSPAVSGTVVEQALAAQTTMSPPPEKTPQALPLTPRQREILTLLASGESMKQAAHRLQLSVKTVETHRAQIMERLDIHDVPRLVLYAVRNGLVPLEPAEA